MKVEFGRRERKGMLGSWQLMSVGEGVSGCSLFENCTGSFNRELKRSREMNRG